jgi:hypothetical protein
MSRSQSAREDNWVNLSRIRRPWLPTCSTGKSSGMAETATALLRPLRDGISSDEAVERFTTDQFYGGAVHLVDEELSGTPATQDDGRVVLNPRRYGRDQWRGALGIKRSCDHRL